MKTSIGNKIIGKILKIVGAKNLYENIDFLARQGKINEKTVKPPLPSAKKWNKYDIGDFYYYTSKGKNDNQVIVYFHGGAFVSGPNIFHWNYLKKLRRTTKLPIYLPIYPKAPNYNYQATYDFLFEFFSQILKKHKHSEFIFMGDSAGGNIAISFTLQLEQRGLKLPNKIILFSPCLDLTFTNQQINEIEKLNIDPFLTKKGTQLMSKEWMKPRKDADNPIFSPINANLSCLKNIKGVYIFVGTHEILYPEACQFHERLFKEKVNVVFVEKNGLHHAWPLHPIKEGKQAVKTVTRIILN